MPPECVDLTLDSDEDDYDTSNTSRGKRRVPSPDSDVVLVVDDGPRERKRQCTQAQAAAADDQDDDVVLESVTGTVALRDLAHSRPQCGNHAFRQSSCSDNSTRCEQCYCYVCDIKAADCKYWGNGSRARDHCNAHASHYWNSLRKVCRKGGHSSTAVLQQEFSSSSSVLSTNWAQPAAANNKSSLPAAAGGRGVMSPLVALWGRKQNENASRAPPAAAAAAAAAGTPAAAAAAATPAAAAAAVRRSSVKVEGTKQQQQPQQQQNQKQGRPRPLLPPASTWLKRIPHPSQLKAPTQLLVRLELPFKTVKGVTVDDVAQRLVPCGFYKDSTKMNVQYGEHLLLDNITSEQYVAEKRKAMPLNLQLLPLLPADALPLEPDTDRPYKVTVISTTPGVKALTVGVVVPLGSKVSKLQEALQEALAAHGFDSSQEGLLLGHITRNIADDAPVPSRGLGEGHIDWFKTPDSCKLNDQAQYTNRHNTWLAVRVPGAVAEGYYGTAPPSLTNSHPQIVLLQHEMYQPRATGAPTPGSDSAESEPPESEEDEDDYDSDDDMFGMGMFHSLSRFERYEERLQRRLQRRQARGAAAVREVTEMGPPMAVLVPEGMNMTGGPAADKALKEAIIAHLVHYRAEGGPVVPSALSSWEHLKLYRMSGLGRQRMLTSLYGGVVRDFSISNPDNLFVSPQHPGARMWVLWGTDPVEQPPGFDMDAFTAQPQLNDPAFEQRLADLPETLKAARAYDAVMKMLRAMPHEIIRELQTACACSVPPTDNTPQQLIKVTHKPSAATVLKVIKALGSSSSSSSKGGSSSKAGSSKVAAMEVAATGSTAAAAIMAAAAHCAAKGKSADLSRLGVLQVEVYVFTTPGRLHMRLFEDYDDWGGTIQGRPGKFRSTTCQLASVLNARLLQESGGYNLLKQINALGGADKPAHGIAKLMEWVAAGERPAAVQPPGLTVTLHPYQLQSLAFMQEAERWEGGWRQLLWRWLPPTAPTVQQLLAGPSSSAAAAAGAGSSRGGGLLAAAKAGDGAGVWWSPVLGRVASSVPPQPWGGFLAEEMGLGKTVEVLGLILSNPPLPSVIAGRIDPESSKVVSRGTLVVCAVSLVGQWCTEAAKKLNGSLKMYPYHGSNRIRDKYRLATEFDIVVTTYATLGSDFGGKKNQHRADSPLGGIKWHRIVFDEGHTVKNMAAAHSKACTALVSDRRWICTGTPINNDISDLLGQFSVLHMQPFATKSYFDAYVKHAFASYGYGVSTVPLLYTLRHTMIRHTKAQTIQGQSVLALPDKTEDLVPVVLSRAEREAYMRVHNQAADVWAAVRGMSSNTINQKLLQVMSLLQPLRRICSGGRLTPNDLRVPTDLMTEATIAHAAAHAAAAPPPAAAAAVGSPMKEDCNISVPDYECPICLDAFDTPVMTTCTHWFCKECILGVLSANPHCPMCRGPVTRADLRAPGKKPEPAPPKQKKRRRSKSSNGSDSEGGSESDDGDWQEDDAAEPAAADGAGSSGLATRRGTRFGAGVGDDQAVVCESKLRALLAELTAMRAADPSSKALVFSQYSNTLEWLKQRLPEEGFGYRTITGSMPLKQRSKAIEAFQGDPPTTVFLLSIRSGAVGINLTAANHVFLLEPCINPALEEQAIGRAWRMGQTRPVVVKRFYVKGSIEERIMDVRKIRQGHASHAPGAGGSSGAAAASSPVAPARMGRNKRCAAELAGNLQADRQVLKIAELDLLFRTPQLDVAAADAAAAGGGGSNGLAAAAAGGSSGLAAATAAAAAGSSGLAAAAGDGAGSSRQAEQAVAAGSRDGEQHQGQQEAVDPSAAAAGRGGGGCAAAGGSMGPPALVPAPRASAAAAGSAGEVAAAAAAAAGGSSGGSDDAAAAATGEVELPESEFPFASQEARDLAEEAGLQSSQEMTPYLLAQLQQQQQARLRFEQMLQRRQQQQ